jgi:hypothetical protein
VEPLISLGIDLVNEPGGIRGRPVKIPLDRTQFDELDTKSIVPPQGVGELLGNIAIAGPL